MPERGAGPGYETGTVQRIQGAGPRRIQGLNVAETRGREDREGGRRADPASSVGY